MQDAFLKKGFGIGRTFSGFHQLFASIIFLPIKISKSNSLNGQSEKLSDHYMLVADLELKKSIIPLFKVTNECILATPWLSRMKHLFLLYRIVY